MPGITRQWIAGITAGAALWGQARGVISFLGLRRLVGTEREVHWTDLWFYGIFPSVMYIAFGLVALAFWSGWEWATYGLAAALTAALLLAIRNEWDLITWMAPRKDGDPNPDSAPY